MNTMIIVLVALFVILIYALTAIKIYKNANSTSLNPLWLILILLLPVLGPLFFLSYGLPRKKKNYL